MGLLDELKKEAEQVKAQAEEERSSTLARQAAVAHEIVPRMLELYEYFRQFKNHLSVVDPGLTASYDVQGVGTLEGLRQGDYRLYTDDQPEHITKFTFQYSYSRNARQEIRHSNRATAQQQKEYLWEHNLKFTTRDASDGSTIFVLDLQVPVTFEFSADLEKAAIRLRVRNLKWLNTVTHTFEPGKVDQAFMEEIAKCVLHKPNKFDQVTGNRVTDTTRLRLREQIALEKARRERELGRPATVTRKKVVKKKIVKKKVRKGEAAKQSLTERFSRTFLGRKG